MALLPNTNVAQDAVGYLAEVLKNGGTKQGTTAQNKNIGWMVCPMCHGTGKVPDVTGMLSGLSTEWQDWFKGEGGEGGANSLLDLLSGMGGGGGPQQTMESSTPAWIKKKYGTGY